MRLYHGSMVDQLTRIKVFSCDKGGRNVAYLTDSHPYSLFYIRDREIDFVTCGIYSDGKVQYDEKFPGQLEEIYDGISGYCYEVKAEAEQTKTPGVWVCRQDAVVVRREYIENVYDAIMEAHSRGRVSILRYEELSTAQRSLNHQGMVHTFLNADNMHIKRIKFLQNHFPEAWEEAQNILAHSS